jgi:ribosomal protein S27AE
MQIEHQCPQCGGAVTLEETDRLLLCSFCKSKLYIQAKDYFRYYFPPAPEIKEEIIFVPYWRFRGMHFACRTSGIKIDLIDKTLPAVSGNAFPPTLGIRPQSLKLKFARDMEGFRFLAPTLPFHESLVETQNRLSYELITTKDFKTINACDEGSLLDELEVRTELKEDRLYYEYFVAETLSIIYTPTCIRNNILYDAILMRPLSKAPAEQSLATETVNADWPLTFLPTLCPNCGWDLISEVDSYILPCTHCHTAWEVSQGTLRSIPYMVAHKNDHQRKATLLPFWRIKAEITGMNLRSYGDLMKLANIPRAFKSEWNKSDLAFWIPAFKISSPAYLRTARLVTIAHPSGELTTEFGNSAIYPASIPLAEAYDSLKGVITDIAVRKQDILPRLEKMTITITESLLVFIPFFDENYELVEPEIRCGLMKNALRWGKNL